MSEKREFSEKIHHFRFRGKVWRECYLDDGRLLCDFYYQDADHFFVRVDLSVQHLFFIKISYIKIWWTIFLEFNFKNWKVGKIEFIYTYGTKRKSDDSK